MNRLESEKSPYLLQHKDNPVDWYPWGEEAFQKAKEENKPVFLSIGYATCHWCHVMEHESFEDEETAKLMNEAFVSIKVDREERPDIDNTYMTVCQMLTGSGGWPLTIIMTPEKEPFFAATYIPKKSRPNMIGMLDLIPRISSIWENERDRIRESTEKIKAGFSQTLALGKSTVSLPENIIEKTRNTLAKLYDPEEGGFGGAPKFPSAHNLLFLLNKFRFDGDEKSRKMSLHTLQKMRLGGIWDHIGKGFHRYSTDNYWLLPHFEKMLYDQAMLLMAYTEGWESTGNPLFQKTALDIIDYVDECLTSPEGLFYSAEDADSEGEEGKFYVWSRSEITDILSPDDAELFCDIYQILKEGNYHDEATRQTTGNNIPFLKYSLADEARQREMKPEELEENLERIRTTLHEHRENRVRPLLDDKILTDWNGLMIAALARAGTLFQKPGLIQKAEKAWEGIRSYCLQDNKLLHRLKDGEAAIEGMANDYTFTIWGLLELYDATFQPRYLNEALNLQQVFSDHFRDDEHGGFYFTPDDSEHLLGRQKEIYDGALPSSNSVAALNGFRLSRLTGNMEWEQQSLEIFQAFSGSVADAPAGYTFAMHAYQVIQSDTMEIVISGPDEKTAPFIQTCRKHAPPGTTILLKTPATAELLDELSSFSKSYPVDEKPAVYVCRNFECKMPVSSEQELIKILSM